MKNIFTPIGAICGSLSLAALSFAFAAPAQAITWNWSFTGNTNQSASGTFETADVTPTAKVTYTITGITGTYKRNSVDSYTITGLSNTASNTFQWDGTPSSSLLSNVLRIGFNTSPGNNVATMYYSGSGYQPVNETGTSFDGTDDSIVSSTLSPATPVPWETDALSVVGTTILFGLGVWSKRNPTKPLDK